MVDLSTLMRRIADIYDRIAGKPDLRWAVVTDDTPLEIQYDAAPAPLLGSPDTLVGGLQIGDRVLCAVSNLRVTVIGRAKGQQIELPAASETMAGVAEIATQAETNTGTDDERFLTPKKLRDQYVTGTITNGTGWVSYSSHKRSLIRIGNMVYLNVTLQVGATSLITSILSVPSGFRPTQDLPVGYTQYSGGAGKPHGNLFMSSAGVLSLVYYQGSGAVNDYVPISACWPII
jgi:hypothetical protein